MSFKNFSTSQNMQNKEQAAAKASKISTTDQKSTTPKEPPVADLPKSYRGSLVLSLGWPRARVFAYPG